MLANKEEKKMKFTRNEIEKTDRKILVAKLKNIFSHAEKIIMWLRYQDKKITRKEYESFYRLR